MKNGADTCCLTAETGINLGAEWRRGPVTPLLRFLDLVKWQVRNSRGNLELLQKKIQIWAEMVRQAGIDLCQYGAREAQVWKTLPGYESPCRWHGASYLRVLQLLFGATPADWSLEVQGRPLLESGILELRNPPGSFPRDQRVPTKIFWRPSTEEMDEGIWKTVAAFTISPRSMKLENAIKILVEEEIPFFVKTIEDTQDDAGAISLLSLRANRTSRSWRTSASRSNSQPASLLRANSIKHEFNTLSGLHRYWLPVCHFCPFDSKWSMECGGDRHAWPEAPDDDLERFRDCIQGRKDRLASVQESIWWENFSFLACIAACQDAGGLRPRNPAWLRKHGHTGRMECPQNCKMVNLKQLHVPKELRPYHPSLTEPE